MSRKSPQERFWSKVAKTDTCWLWTAHRNVSGYGKFMIRVDGSHRASLAHRVAYELAVGPIPEGFHIDHTCHNPACVKPSHLRPVTNKENLENRDAANSNTKSGVLGVSWFPRDQKWRATVTHHGRQHSAGYYSTVAEAEAAVVELRNRLFTHNDADRQRGAA